MKTWSKYAKIGLAFLVGIVMIYFGLNFLKGVNVFQKQNTYISVFDNVNNLNVSSPVLVNGFQVGLVNSIHMMDNDSMDLAVEIRLDKGFKVKKGSKLEFNTDFLGGSSVNLLNNPYGTEYLSPGDTILGTRAVGLMDGVARVIPKTDSIMTRLDLMSVALLKLATSPDWVTSLEAMSGTMQELQTSTKSLKNVLSELENNLPGMAENLSAITTDFRKVSQNLAEIDVSKTFNSLDSTLLNLQELSASLTRTDNTLGKLTQDTQLHDSITSTINSATKLLEDIRENPEKYLSVRLRLF
ncbi:MAG: MlaD family protein [Dysgonamonadaceae bacterium]|jgi:phospholipid/cholesterol/gamma-HCH transport system substrate-binding protein|nr:MlaD family protein [Dysgonamonadaceae bacterium]